MCLGSECLLPPHMVFKTLMALIKCPQLVSDEKAKLIRAYDMSIQACAHFSCFTSLPPQVKQGTAFVWIPWPSASLSLRRRTSWLKWKLVCARVWQKMDVGTYAARAGGGVNGSRPWNWKWTSSLYGFGV